MLSGEGGGGVMERDKQNDPGCVSAYIHNRSIPKK